MASKSGTDSETATGLLVRSPVGRNSGTPRIAPDV